MGVSLLIKLSTVLATFYRVHGSVNAASTFHAGESGIEGSIVLFQGILDYDLDFTGVDWSLLPDNCTEDGLEWHVHVKWGYDEAANSVGATCCDRMHLTNECNSTWTGDIYDPWMACGTQSASADCLLNGGCIPPSSVFEEADGYFEEYICDEENYDLLSYTCSSGDWSGKYGPLYATYWDNSTGTEVLTGDHLISQIGSYWELNQEDLYVGNAEPAIFSIVLHCGDMTPAFCAPLVRDNSAFSTSIVLGDTEVIDVEFEEAGFEFDNFTISWNNQGVEFNIPEAAGMLCSEWYLTLYEDYPYYIGTDAAAAKTECDIVEFGGIYDPTHTCIANSGSFYCVDGFRCNETATNYDCSGDLASNTNKGFRGCAVGDVSARIGTIQYDQGVGGLQVINLEDPMSPPLFILGDRGVVLECLDNLTITGGYSNICAGTVCENCTSLAPINNITSAPTMQTEIPTNNPSKSPTSEPTLEPSRPPTTEPTTEPTTQPTTQPTIQTTDEDDQGEANSGLSGGAVAGIVIGILIFLIIIGVIIYCIIAKRNKDDGSDHDDHETQVELNKAKSQSDGDDGGGTKYND